MSRGRSDQLDGRTKGLPAGTHPLSRDEIADKRFNVLNEDLPLPLAVLKESSLAHNSEWMKSFRKMRRPLGGG